MGACCSDSGWYLLRPGEAQQSNPTVRRDNFEHYTRINFSPYRDSTYSPDEPCMTIQKRGPGAALCYGSWVISSTDDGIYQWTFKILNQKVRMAIGIDTTYKRMDGGWFGDDRSKSYSLWSNGTVDGWDGESKKTNLKFGTNDIIIMSLDLKSQTLSYKINEGDKHVLFKNIKIWDDINYCMAVCMTRGGENWPTDKIQLIDFV